MTKPLQGLTHATVSLYSLLLRPSALNFPDEGRRNVTKLSLVDGAPQPYQSEPEQ
jgi:hypothetical protein